MRKPRVFIASSVESLDVADAINLNLDHQTDVTLWKNDTFRLSTSSIDSLLKKAQSVDFSIFIFTPDDLARIREQDKAIIRDNVLFELGLFIGILGKKRCFIIKPRDTELHFPTDLLGLTPAEYEANRSDNDLVSAINYPCVLIKKEISDIGLISQYSNNEKPIRKPVAYNYEISNSEQELLLSIFEEYTESPNGVSIWNIFNKFSRIDKARLNLSAIKLERMGYLEKGIDVDQSEEFYTFIITADGVDYLLKNEHLFEEKAQPPVSIPKPPQVKGSFDDFDDDIPF